MPTILIGILLLLILAALVWYFRSRGAKTAAIPEIHATPVVQDEPSIFDTLKTRFQEEPDEAIDQEALPPLPAQSFEKAGLAPDFADALLGSEQGKSGKWTIVCNLIRDINAGAVPDWQTVEDKIAEIDISSCLDRALENLRLGDITSTVKRLFWDMARSSRNYEAVRWGIAIGSISLQESEIPDLLVLARHPEFSHLASHALLRESQTHPEFKQHLAELLPTCYGRSIVHIINDIVLDEELINDKDVQRNILIYGMKNSATAKTEIAFTTAKAIDIAAFAQEGTEEDETYRAVVELINTLIDEPGSFGGLAQVNNWPVAYEAYLQMIEARPADSISACALASLENYLANEELEWPSRESELSRVQNLAAQKSISFDSAGGSL